MRLHFAVLVAVAASLAPWTAAGQTFPYKAHITADEVYVRSGPGEDFYPTGKLRAGAEVEVYRHDPGDWLAIRPPKGSFTWVSARHLKPGKDALAEVTGDRVAARVGSELSEQRDVIQVRLERGETVEVLGTKQMGNGDSAATWYKISPPSGEFRWVHGKYVDANGPGDGSHREPSEPGPLAPPGRRAAGHTGKASEPPPRWSPSGAVDVPKPRTRSRGEISWPDPTPPRRLTAGEFQAELDDINSELSIMLVEEPTVWNCEDLARRAKTLVDQAHTAVERGNARVLANRIAQAESIKRREEAATGLRSAAGRRSADLARAGIGGLRPRGSEDQFDAVGRLTRVLPAKLGAPRYALVDDQGNVLAYVSPAPGMNMQYYLGRRIGINGVRGYIAEQNAEHLTAKHVTMLDTRVR
jgi:hypothetical protein